jgi:putative addiction module component (TIGR02574 family)
LQIADYRFRVIVPMTHRQFSGKIATRTVPRRIPISATLQDLKNAVSELPNPQRAELAHFLLQSLDPEEEGRAESWETELAQRLDDIKTGRVVGVPAEDVLARLRKRYP